MINKFWSGMLMCGALQIGLAAGTQAKTDPLRCEARTLRYESSFYVCWARCGRQMDAQQDRVGDAAKVRNEKCVAMCQLQYTKRMAATNAKPPCREIVATPDPFECKALYLRAESNYMICQVSCEGTAHQDDCTDTCTQSYESKLDEVKADPVCTNGPATIAITPGQ